jgi:hypothetical protein
MRLRIPRSLIDARQQDLPPADDEGLVTVQLQLEAGVVQRIDAAPAALGAAAPLAITPPVDAHAHLDKTFSHGDFPNPGGTMGGALAANRLEFEALTADQVRHRSERALQRAWRYGLRAIRSHIDSGAGPASEASWEVLCDQQRAWLARVYLQLLALVPIQHWLTPEGEAKRRLFLLQVIQPGLVGLMDGSVSTLAPLFAAAFATGSTWETFLVGTAASVGAGISMGLAEGLSDDGKLTGRGHPLIRGLAAGIMTTIGGMGHALPYLIPDFTIATWVAEIGRASCRERV